MVNAQEGYGVGLLKSWGFFQDLYKSQGRNGTALGLQIREAGVTTCVVFFPGLLNRRWRRMAAILVRHLTCESMHVQHARNAAVTAW